MNVLMAGGSGLIGSRLTQNVLQAGNKVWILSRYPERMRQAQGIQAVGWDAATPRGWGGLVEQMDVVINLTGENLGAGRWTAARRASFYSSRVNSGKALVAAIAQSGSKPKVVVQASAVGYYGDGGDQELDEQCPPGSDSLAQLCVDWENSTRAVEDLGVRRVVIRTGVALAPHAAVFKRLTLPFKLFVGGPIGSGRQWLPWIHLDDVVAAIRFLIDDPAASGAYNLTSPQPMRNAEFGKTLAKAMRRPYWMPVPGFALRLALGEMSRLVLEGQRALPHRLLAAGYVFRYEQLEAVLSDLLVKD
ncbi:MAG: TIGR01777 family oxidoreductase [Bellilinea sp.]